MKLLKERLGTTLKHIGIGNSFMNQTPIAQQWRERVGKWDCNKLKSFCTAKNIVTKLPINERKSLPNPVNKWANEVDRQFSKEEIQMTNK
jgi:hypothetical protein